MIDAITNISSGDALGKVRVPRLLLFDQTTSTQVLEDLASTVDLKTILASSDSNIFLVPSIGFNVGHGLGTWLRGFHEWTSAPEQAEFRELVAQNRAMQELKQNLACNGILKVSHDFPELLNQSREWPEVVQEASAKDLKQATPSSDDDWGVIHGDFWSGNRVFQSHSSS